MCGIAGFIAGTAQRTRRRWPPCWRAHCPPRPRRAGHLCGGPAALGHCRLAIIDLEGGAQPLYSEDKNLVVVFNGEIYNYRALTAELTALGHTLPPAPTPRSCCTVGAVGPRAAAPAARDVRVCAVGPPRRGAVLCAGYVRHQAAVLLPLRRRHAAFRQRDQGVFRPPVVCQAAQHRAAAALPVLPVFPGAGYVFAGVQKLLPGHFLEFSDGIVRTTRWVQPAFLPGDAPVSLPRSKKSCAAVRRRTRSPTSRSRGSCRAAWTRPT